MDERSLERLEYPKILERLAAEARFSLGAERCRALRPAVDAEEVRLRQAETEEAARLLEREPEIPLAGLVDIRRSLQRAAKGGVLSPEELLAVASTLRGARRLRGFLLPRRDGYPRLAGRAERLEPQPAVEEAVDAAIAEDGRVRDTASPRLAALRRQRADLEAAIRRKLEELIRSPQGAAALREPLITQRRGRFVLPVKAEARAALPGVVHDESASGATLFVEPMPVVELGNRLRAVEAEEREEIQRILAELSRQVAAVQEAVDATLAELAELDAIVARGRLALAMRAERPETVDEPRVSLRRARHPLLEGRAVPIDIWLGGEAGFDTLVITGPNTGGKTVALKTVGLLALMHQAGLHIPAAPGSLLGVFPQIFCDLGDEQSIEQSLSTFSSHMSAIVGFVHRAGPGALVLLDEIGAGTDPDEGAALAIALLEHFRSRGCLTVATTHYSALKAYAYREPGVENASVEFDAETLRPTYRLWIGLPGKSMALTIADRLGLPARLVERARQIMGAGTHRVEELIAAMEEDRRETAALRAQAEAGMAEVRALQEQWARQLEQQRREHHARLQAMEAQLAEAVAEAKRRTEGLVGRLRDAMARLRAALEAPDAGPEGAQGALAQAEEAIGATRTALRQLEDDLAALRARARRAEQEARAAARERVAAALRPGARVEVVSLRQEGEVVEVPADPDGPVTVQAGVLRLRVPRADLRVLGEGAGGAGQDRGASGGAATATVAGGGPGELPEAGGGGTRPAGPRPGGRGPAGETSALLRAKAQAFSPELHLRQLTVDDALERLDKYLDDAVLAGATQVRVIHGKGTGALRQAVHRFLRGHRAVESFRLGAPHEGGAGATVVRLRDR